MLIDFVAWEGTSEVDAAVDALHPHAILLVLVEVGEDLKEILFGHVRDQLDHVVEDKRGAFADLWNLILRCLHEQVDDVPLVARREVWVDHWKELHCCQLRSVGLSIHKPLNHLDDLLA